MNAAKNIFLILLIFIYGGANGQTITTIAGMEGSPGFSGDGGPATMALLSSPNHISVDAMGNIYINDFSNQRIRKINAAGIITTAAGIGASWNTGDGGPATAAGIAPDGIALDLYGNLLIASDSDGSDTTGTWIRKVDAAGIITTIAGNGTWGDRGDGGPATAAGFSGVDITTDTAGNIYIAEIYYNRIRKINAAGIITTFAGNGIAGDTGDGGQATAAEINHPNGVAADNFGNVYIADRGNNKIRKVSTTGMISTVAGTGTASYTGDGGPATAATLNTPFGVATGRNGNIYIADAGNGCIRMVNISGTVVTVAGNGIHGDTGDGGPATGAELDLPVAVAVDATGNIYITDGRLNVVRKVTVSTTDVNTQQTFNSGILSLWPNPNHGSFTLTLSSPTNEDAQITITNLLGEKVKECTVPTNMQIAIQLNTPPGIYFLTTVTGQDIQSVKVMVK